MFSTLRRDCGRHIRNVLALCAFAGCAAEADRDVAQDAPFAPGEHRAPTSNPSAAQVVEKGSGCWVDLTWCSEPGSGLPVCRSSGSCSYWSKRDHCDALIRQICGTMGLFMLDGERAVPFGWGPG
jgi:hypothetical protein